MSVEPTKFLGSALRGLLHCSSDNEHTAVCRRATTSCLCQIRRCASLTISLPQGREQNNCVSSIRNSAAPNHKQIVNVEFNPYETRTQNK